MQQLADQEYIRNIQNEGEKASLEQKKKELDSKVLDSCRALMKKTVKVNTINKYQKIFYGELGITATQFCNNITGIFSAETYSQALRLIKKKHFMGVTNISIPLPTRHDPNHTFSISL